MSRSRHVARIDASRWTDFSQKAHDRPYTSCLLKNESPEQECTLENSGSPGSLYWGGLDFLFSLTNSNAYENLIHWWVLARWNGTVYNVFSQTFLSLLILIHFQNVTLLLLTLLHASLEALEVIKRTFVLFLNGFVSINYSILRFSFNYVMVCGEHDG